jgi:RNA polymerase sigma-70 factor, ECF subfamily
MALREVRNYERRASRPLYAATEFDTLYARYFSDVLTFIGRRVADRDLAAELAQETFLRAFGARTRFDPSRPVWPWLQQIAQNLIRNALRDEHRRRTPLRSLGGAEMLVDSDRLTDPEASYENTERVAGIRTALEELSPRSRRVLLRRCDEAASYDEIAAAEGLTNDAVKSVLKRARRTFRVAFARWEGDLAIVLWPGRRLMGRLKRAGAQLSIFMGGAPADSLAQLIASGVAVAVMSGAFIVGGGVSPERAFSDARSSPHTLRVSPSSPKAVPSAASERRTVTATPVSAPVDVSVSTKRTDHRREFRVDQRDDVDGGGRTEIGVQLPCRSTAALCVAADAVLSKAP